MNRAIFWLLMMLNKVVNVPPAGSSFMITETSIQMITESGDPMITE